MGIEGTDRILQLLSLLSARRTWTGTELAERLGTTGRTVRRDIDRLRMLGYQIDGVRGSAGRYQLSAGADLPPLFLDDDEAVAVVVALLIAANRSTGMDDSTTRALAKLHHVMPPPLLKRLEAVHAGIRTVLGTDSPQVDPRTVAGLAEASRDRLRVTFDYLARDGAATTRRVEPHRLVTGRQLWYLVAYDLDRNDWRVFRVDRITELTITGHGFDPRTPPGGELEALVGQAIARTPMAHHATVAVPLPAAEVQARRPALLADRITAVDRSACTVALAADDLDAIVNQIAEVLPVAPGCTLDADDEITAGVRALAEALTAAAPVTRARRAPARSRA